MLSTPLPSTPDSVTLPSQARAVIIGGGIMGCALAYHLAGEGWDDIVLLEKAELTSGSTWHAAGQLTYATSSQTMGKCVAYNIDLYNRLEQETGYSPTWHGCGSLRVAYSADEVDWFRHILSVGRGLQLPMEIVSVERMRQLHPFYNFDGIIAGLHTSIDGHLDPAGAAFALVAGAKQKGAKIIRRCRATGITHLSNGEWQVSTEKGEIVCEHIINAGGMYARQIALWNGYDLPAVCMSHHYFVTDKVPEFESLAVELPVVRDDKNVSGYLRMEQKSFLIGIYEKTNVNHVWEDGAPWLAENELFEPHYERVGAWLEAAMERMPVVSQLGIKRAVHGAISHPPDGNPLIGPAPKLQNYWCCAGCQIGIGWGPGLTRELARWIAHGSADISMREFDPRRFGDYANQQYQVIKGREDYTLRHEIPYPHFSRVASRPLRVSALYDTLKQQGAVYEEVYGWERPRWFGAAIEQNNMRPGAILPPPADVYSFRRCVVDEVVAKEVMAVRARGGIMDISAFAKIEVSGADVASFVDSVIAGRLPKVGKIGLRHILNRRGRIELETTVARLSDDCFYFVCAAFFERRLYDALDFARDKTADITLINRSDEWGALTINGPRARDIVAATTTAAVDNESFAWMQIKQITVGGGLVWASRMSYAGELGWEFHGDKSAIKKAYDALWQAGEKYGVGNYGSFAMNAMRLEKMFKGAGELTNEVMPQEADIMRFIDLDKPSFIGRDAVLAAQKTPLRWKCAYLAISSDGVFDGHGGEAVLDGDAVIGVISSIAYGHTVNKLLAFAYVSPDYAAAGNKIQVMIMGEIRQAIVLDKAAYDADNNLPRDSNK